MASAFVADSATVERRREPQHVVPTHSQYLCGAANPKGEVSARTVTRFGIPGEGPPRPKIADVIDRVGLASGRGSLNRSAGVGVPLR